MIKGRRKKEKTKEQRQALRKKRQRRREREKTRKSDYKYRRKHGYRWIGGIYFGPSFFYLIKYSFIEIYRSIEYILFSCVNLLYIIGFFWLYKLYEFLLDILKKIYIFNLWGSPITRWNSCTTFFFPPIAVKALGGFLFSYYDIINMCAYTKLYNT